MNVCRKCGAKLARRTARHCTSCMIANNERLAARRRAHPITAAVRARVMDRDGGVCRACFRPTVESTDRYGHDHSPEIDHIVPMDKGGTSEEHNLQLLCRRCNRSKGTKVPV